jgi:hypothetical protein
MGGFDVTPSELDAAGATLRRVRSELSVGNGIGAGGLAGGDVGYPDLSDVMADFCRMAIRTGGSIRRSARSPSVSSTTRRSVCDEGRLQPVVRRRGV